MKTRILILVIIIASIVLVVASVFAGKKNASAKEATSRSGYTQITSVDGVSFYVNSKFTDSATAITQVSDNVDFATNQYYSFKNGVDSYLLFNMEQLVIACQKGTDFGINTSNDKEYSLQNSSVLNIWFTKGTKKFESNTKGEYTITPVNAGVSINSSVYGDFTGQLVNINKDGEEWSLFVGVPGQRYDKLSKTSQEGIESITSSFVLGGSAELLSQDVYAVSITGDGNKQTVETTEVETSEDTIALSQVEIAEKEEDMAYSSTPYNMLLLGDNGLMNAFNEYDLVYEEPIVRPTRILRGNDAVDLIKEFCRETKQYDYFEAPEGSAWEVVEYDVCYRNCARQPYVNVKFKGLDGDVLRYRGIKYTARSYDMDFKLVADDDWIRHLYAYYAVPNGCYEYCLEIGERYSVNGQDVNAAYYHIYNDDKIKLASSSNPKDKETTLSDEDLALVDEIVDEFFANKDSNEEADTGSETDGGESEEAPTGDEDTE